jgi:PAS domain S-box-containing protein
MASKTLPTSRLPQSLEIVGAARPEILRTIGWVAEHLLTVADGEQEIEAGLPTLGTAVGASRAYIFENHRDERNAVLSSQRYEWVAEGTAPQIDNRALQNVPLRAAGFGRWEEVLSRGGVIQGRVQDFPPSEQEFLRQQEIRSLVVVPIFTGDTWWGFVGFDACGVERAWSPAEVEALRTATGILGGAIRHQRTEAALRHSEERYRRLVEQSPDAIVVHRRGRILYTNSAGLRLAGIEPASPLLDREILDFVHADDHELVRRWARRTQASSRTTAPIEIRMLRADGSTVPVESTATSVHFDGRIATQIVLRDITERKRAEESARELIREQAARAAAEDAEQWARFLAGAGTILASSLDYQTTLRSVARLATSSLADSCVIYIIGEGGGLRHLEVAHADPEKERILWELLTRDPPNPLQPRSPISRVVSTGRAEIIPQTSEAWLHSSAQGAEHIELCRRVMARSLMCVPLSVRGQILGAMSFGTAADGRYGAGDLALAQELANRAAMAVDNARLYQEAREASQTKSEFMAVMSHELRTPLTAITTYADMLDAGYSGELSATQQQQVRVISANAMHLAKLIDEVLTYTRTEAERLEVYRERVDLGDLARELIEWLRPMAEDKGLALVLHPPRGGAMIESDITRLKQILVNLLSNAVRFTNEGRIEVTVERTGERYWIRVADTGCGIAPEHQSKIFEPFWQVNRSFTRRSGGTGLGLSIVRRLTMLLGGDVMVQSVEGKGSTFSVWLPVAQP